MSTTVRLGKDLEAELDAVARKEGVTKSVVIKRSVAEYVARLKQEHSSYELGKDLFGRWGSGESDRGTKRKEHLKDILREKVSGRLGPPRRTFRSKRSTAP